MKILAIDPSLLHCGWAILKLTCDIAEHCNIDIPHGTIRLQAYGTIKAPKELKEEEIVIRIAFVLSELDKVPWPGIQRIVIEQPESWGAYKSLASSHSGSLLLLNLLTGAIVGWALNQTCRVGDEEIILVKVSKWKGQLPKTVTQSRMEKKYNVKFATNDEADATGLGDWYLTQQLKEVNNGTKG